MPILALDLPKRVRLIYDHLYDRLPEILLRYSRDESGIVLQSQEFSLPHSMRFRDRWKRRHILIPTPEGDTLLWYQNIVEDDYSYTLRGTKDPVSNVFQTLEHFDSRVNYSPWEEERILKELDLLEKLVKTGTIEKAENLFWLLENTFGLTHEDKEGNLIESCLQSLHKLGWLSEAS